MCLLSRNLRGRDALAARPRNRRGRKGGPVNTVTAVGTLVDPLRLERSPKGVDFVRFTIDVAKRSKDDTTKVMRFQCIARDDIARNLAATVEAGDRLIVAGEVRQSKQRNRIGAPVTVVELVVADVAPSLRYVGLR
jgi:single-stranded DNA-binding protein